MKVIKSFASINFCGVSESSTLKNRLINKINMSNYQVDPKTGETKKSTKEEDKKPENKTSEDKQKKQQGNQLTYRSREGIEMKRDARYQPKFRMFQFSQTAVKN